MSTAAAMSAEVLKVIIMLAFQELKRKGMSAEEFDEYARVLRLEINDLDPADIPDV